MSEPKTLIIDIDDPLKAGIYRDFESTARGSFGVSVRNDELLIKFRPVRRSDIDNKIWEDVNTQSCSHDWAMGLPDQIATSGIWATIANGNPALLAALAYNITAAALATAMNGNGAVIAAGGVTVKSNRAGTYEVECVNVNQVINWTTGTDTLWPDADVRISTPRVAGVNTKQLSIFKITQGPYARCTTFNSIASSAVNITSRQNGTETKKAVQRLVFTQGLEPYEGNLIFNWDKPEIVNLPCKANIGDKEEYNATLLADVAGNLAGLYDDVPDDAGPVRIWLSNGVAAAPPVPAGGRLLAVAYTNGFSAAQMAVAYATAVDADAKFVASVTNITQVKIVANAEGAREDVIPRNSGIVFAKIKDGTNGPLAGKTVKLFVQSGNVALYWQVAGGAVPVAATLCDRAIGVVVTPSDSAATVAANTKTIVDGDAELIAVVIAGSNTVKITDVFGGERDDAEDIDSGLNPTVKQHGKSFTANVAYDAPERDIEAEFSNQFEVIRRKNGNIDFRSISTGVIPLITVDAADLAFPNILEGVMNLNTYGMFSAFNATDAEFLPLILEGKIQFPGRLFSTYIRVIVRVYRSVVDEGTMIPSPGSAYNGVNFRVTGGGELQIKNRDTGNYHPVWISGLAGAETLDIDAGTP